MRRREVIRTGGEGLLREIENIIVMMTEGGLMVMTGTDLPPSDLTEMTGETETGNVPNVVLTILQVGRNVRGAENLSLEVHPVTGDTGVIKEIVDVDEDEVEEVVGEVIEVSAEKKIGNVQAARPQTLEKEPNVSDVMRRRGRGSPGKDLQLKRRNIKMISKDRCRNSRTSRRLLFMSLII